MVGFCHGGNVLGNHDNDENDDNDGIMIVNWTGPFLALDLSEYELVHALLVTIVTHIHGHWF